MWFLESVSTDFITQLVCVMSLLLVLVYRTVAKEILSPMQLTAAVFEKASAVSQH
jgi:hypothetical protein